MNAFNNFLLSIPRKDAITHIYECLMAARDPGGPQNFAWDLMAECHGPDWSCRPDQLGEHINKAINHITAKGDQDEK